MLTVVAILFQRNIVEGLYDDLNTPKVIAELNVLSNQIVNR